MLLFICPHHSPDVYQEEKETPMESLMPSIPHHAAPFRDTYEVSDATMLLLSIYSSPCTMLLILLLLSSILPQPLSLPWCLERKVFQSFQQHTAEVTNSEEIKYVTGPGYDLLTERKILLVLFQTRMYSLLVWYCSSSVPELSLSKIYKSRHYFKRFLFFISIFIVKEWLLYFSLCPI